jgi:SAM-dependent methyltransferase
MEPPDSVARFSSRVGDYARHRPSYPPQILDLLRERCNLTPASRVADIGAGTGLLTRLFLENGNAVRAVEPNSEMRAACTELLSGFPNLLLIDGIAESTGLLDESVDLITAAQAFHWFKPSMARAEFARILSPGGWVALIWNERLLDASPFLAGYEKLLRAWGADYDRVAASYPKPEQLARFFAPEPMQTTSYTNGQSFDFDGLRGRLLSSSYAPREGHPNHGPMLADLQRLFDSCQQGGRVVMEYECQIYFGQLKNSS